MGKLLFLIFCGLAVYGIISAAHTGHALGNAEIANVVRAVLGAAQLLIGV